MSLGTSILSRVGVSGMSDGIVVKIFISLLMRSSNHVMCQVY